MGGDSSGDTPCPGSGPARRLGRRHLLLALPVAFGIAAVVAAAPSAAPVSGPPGADHTLPADPVLRSLDGRARDAAAGNPYHVPDPLGPVFKTVKGPFRP